MIRTLACAVIVTALPCSSSTAFFFAQNQPVLAKGSTYDGWQADAIAAPAATWDGTQWVMTASLWNNASGHWASGFFSSSDMRTWTYVAGSLGTPPTGNYILGNAGIQWFGGKYYFAYNQYAANASATLYIATSTDLKTWTMVANPLLSYGADPSLDINPVNGKLEVWYMTASRVIHMQDSPDGSTWTDEGDFLDSTTAGAAFNFGEPSVWYEDTTRYITFDSAPCNGCRGTVMAHSINRDTTWVVDGAVLGPTYLTAWQSQQVFDGSVLVADLADGFGAVPRMLYAGSDNNSATDATDSSIGFAFQIGRDFITNGSAKSGGPTKSN